MSLDQVLKMAQATKKFTDLARFSELAMPRIKSPLDSIINNSAVMIAERNINPFVRSAIHNKYETIGLIDIAQQYNKQFNSFQDAINIFSKAILPKEVHSLIDMTSLANRSNKSFNYFNTLSGLTFKSIIEEYPDIENFETEKEIFERISQDPILNDAQTLLFQSVSDNTITEQDTPSVLQFVNFVGDRFNLGKKERVILFSACYLIITVIIGVGINKLSDALPSSKKDQSAMESKAITPNNTITQVAVDSIVKALNIDLIIVKTYLYANNTIRSKHIDTLSAQTEIRIINYKQNWCYVEVIDKPELKGWVMNKKIEKFQ